VVLVHARVVVQGELRVLVRDCRGDCVRVLRMVHGRVVHAGLVRTQVAGGCGGRLQVLLVLVLVLLLLMVVVVVVQVVLLLLLVQLVRVVLLGVRVRVGV